MNDEEIDRELQKMHSRAHATSIALIVAALKRGETNSESPEYAVLTADLRRIAKDMLSIEHLSPENAIVSLAADSATLAAEFARLGGYDAVRNAEALEEHIFLRSSPPDTT